MQEINLYDLLRYYARNWLNLLSALFIGAIIGLVYTNFIQTPLYKSDATMLVVGARTSQDATINNNYTELFKSRRVLETVIGSQGYAGNYEQLLARTTATNDKNTDILKVSIADPDSRKSEQLLSASLEAFKKEAGDLYGSSNIKTVDAASAPAEPYNVNVPLQVGLSTAATFFLAIIVLFFIYDYRATQPLAKKVATTKASTVKPTASSKAKAKGTAAASAKSKKRSDQTKANTEKQSGFKRFSSLLTGNLSVSAPEPTKKTK